MPVTKKKGAIFAIYSDSPVRPSTSSSTIAPSTRPAPSASSASPTKRPGSVLSRRALSTVQAKAVAVGFPTTSASDHIDKIKPSDVPSKAVPSVNPKHATTGDAAHSRPSTSTSTSTIRTTRQRPPPLQAALVPATKPKRQLEISPAASPSASSAAASAKAAIAAGAADGAKEQTSATAPRVKVKTGQSPAKRTRATPIRPSTAHRSDGHAHASDKDKENDPPPSTSTLDSPASRTRSKTCLSISSISAVQITSPLTLRSRAQPERPESFARQPSSRAVLTSPSAAHPNHDDEDDNENAEPGAVVGGSIALGVSIELAESLVGDGRGTLTLKKGRKVAVMMGRSEVPMPMPLADVSEAYGASGEEPAGFRTQGAR